MHCLTYYVVSISGEHVSMCTCGWLSRGTATSGLAGALWDIHVGTGAGAGAGAGAGGGEGTPPIIGAAGEDEAHALTDLLSVGAEGAVTCRCGWTVRAGGSRSELLDLWVGHVERSEDAARRRRAR